MARKTIIKEMLDHKKDVANTRLIHRLVWMIEERGYSIEALKKRYGLDAASCKRHIFRLYFLRRDLYERMGREKYLAWGRPV